MAEKLKLVFDVDDKGSVKLDNISGKIDKTGQSLNKTTTSANKHASSLNSLAGTVSLLAGAYAAASLVKGAIQQADAWTLVNGRLSLVTDSSQELINVQNKLFDIAQGTRQEFSSVADLYARLARSTEDLGTSQEDLLGVTETINKTLIVSGASATQADAALMQLGQGFASGTLRGDELNSVLEQTPRLAQAIAEGMGVSVGQLRALGAEGKITAESVMLALKDQATAVDKEFSRMPKTVGQSFTLLGNEIFKTIGLANSATDATGGIAEAVTWVAEAVGNNTDDIVNAWLFVNATVGRTIDIFNLLYETGELGAQGLALGAEIAFNNMASDILALLATMSGELEAFGITSEETTTKLAEGSLNALIAANQAASQLRAETLEYDEALQAVNMTVEERMELMRQEAELKQALSDQDTENKIAKKEIEQEEGLDEDGQAALDKYISQLDAKRMALEQSLLDEEEMLAVKTEEKVALADELLEQERITKEEHYALLIAIAEKYEEDYTRISVKGYTERQKFAAKSTLNQAKDVLGLMQSLTAGVANENKAMFNINKAAALANAGINMYEGISLTLSKYPYPVSIAMAALQAAAGAAQISAISSSSFDSGGGATSTLTAGGGLSTTEGIVPTDIGGELGTQATVPTQITINLGDSSIISTDSVRELIEAINVELGDGAIISAT